MPPWAFIHLPRTGGQSLASAIVAQYGERSFKAKSGKPLRWKIVRLIGPEVEIVYGHMGYGLHDYFQVRYATILREPLSRVLSYYRMYRARLLADGKGDLGFEAFLDSPWASNAQTRILAGCFGLPGEPPAETALEMAKAHLQGFEVVGFFPDVAGFASRLGLTVPVPRPADRLEPFHPSPAQMDALQALNAADAALYTWARTTL